MENCKNKENSRKKYFEGHIISVIPKPGTAVIQLTHVFWLILLGMS